MTTPTLNDRKKVILNMFSLLRKAEISVGVAASHLEMSRQVLYKYQRKGVPVELYETFVDFCGVLTKGLESGDLPISNRLFVLANNGSR